MDASNKGFLHMLSQGSPRNGSQKSTSPQFLTIFSQTRFAHSTTPTFENFHPFGAPTINYMAILLEASTVFSGKHIGYNLHTSELSMFSSTRKLGVLTKSNYWVCFFPRIRISLSVPARHEENNVANIEESKFNINKSRSNRKRSVVQCKTHWGGVKKEIRKFCRAYSQARNTWSSGYSDDMIMEKAHIIFKSENNEKPFILDYMWRELEDQPK
uniref:No apical meristem-associated C-terminal domain-containing protein n=1 Tax=Oryza barthii TaxID=65489 RepID=A0A0D3FT07_9ORYZ